VFDLSEIRAALAANLATLADAEGLQINAYMLSNPTPPNIDIFPDKVTYDITMQRGGDSNMLTVRACVGLASDVGAQQKLDRLIASTGASSIKAAIESDPTLGGNCDDLRVTECSGYQVYPQGAEISILAANWTVQVETSH
jgi:hypothetical protein